MTEKQQQGLDIFKRMGIPTATIIGLIFAIGAWTMQVRAAQDALRADMLRLSTDGSNVSHRNTADIQVLKERVDILMSMANENKQDHLRVLSALEKLNDKLEAK